MNRKVIFLHLPKTAGSALKVFFRGALNDFCLQANTAGQLASADPHVLRVKDMSDIRRVLDERGGLALHVDSNFDEVRRTTDFRSLAYLLFAPEHFDYFAQFTILTMVRHPLRRFLSEYGFIRRMQEADAGFLPDLDVRSPDAYLERVHPNAVLHFLLEGDLHTPRTITSDDLVRVKDRIACYPIHVGIHERFDASIRSFGAVLGRSFTSSDLPALNVGAVAPVVDPSVEAEFYQRNRLDMALYNYVVQLFEARSPRCSDQML